MGQWIVTVRSCGTVLVLALLFVFGGFAHGRQLSVTTSILPVADWARNVGKDRVNVSCVLSGGSSPHTFAPSPSDVKRLASADLFIMIGIGLEEWAEDFVSAAAKTDLTILRLGQRIGFKQGDNPHVWLDPSLAQKMVLSIAEVFSRLDPSSKEFYHDNANRYCGEIQSLHERFAPQFAALEDRKVVQFHPAFTYMLTQYSIGVIDVIEPHPGKEPTSKRLQSIIVRLRREPKRVVLIEPQLSSTAAAAVAREASATLVLVDPLGDASVAPRSTYLLLMEFNLNALLRSLR